MSLPQILACATLVLFALAALIDAWGAYLKLDVRRPAWGWGVANAVIFTYIGVRILTGAYA